MLPLEKIKEAERLLREGKLSHRKIAAVVGISRTTIGQLAAGRRPDYEARSLARAAQNEPLGPVARCGSCGGLVHMPCRLCRARAWKAKHQDIVLAARRRARELAIKRLLAAVWKASQQRAMAFERATTARRSA